jgi:hypothetical protein
MKRPTWPLYGRNVGGRSGIIGSGRDGSSRQVFGRFMKVRATSRADVLTQLSNASRIDRERKLVNAINLNPF